MYSNINLKQKGGTRQLRRRHASHCMGDHKSGGEYNYNIMVIIHTLYRRELLPKGKRPGGKIPGPIGCLYFKSAAFKMGRNRCNSLFIRLYINIPVSMT